MASRDVAAIDLALAENWQLSLQGTTVALLVGRARTRPDLAQALLARPDLAPGDLGPLFLYSDEELREAIGRAVGSRAALRPAPPLPREAGAILTGFSGRKDVAGFVGALSDMLGLQRNFLAGTPDPSRRYDLLTLALRAVGLHEEEAVYVFLTLNETVARSVDRVYDLVKLFRTIPRGAARDLLCAVLDMPLAERLNGGSAHQPYAAPDAVRPRMPATERAPLRPALPGRVRQSGTA